MTLRVLDLFACEGGAGAGYVQAGLALSASVDTDAKALARNPNPGPKLCGDWKEGVRQYAGESDFIHASPPCQGYIPNNPRKDSWPLLVNEVRAVLLAAGKPFVIENVPTCEDLENPVSLRGCMFGLTVKWNVPKTKVRPMPDGSAYWEVISGGRKHQPSKRRFADIQNEGLVEFHLERERKFEANGFSFSVPEIDEEIHRLPAISVVHGTPTGFWNQWYAAVVPSEVKKKLMRTPWMTGHGVAESIPPAYTEHIGREFLKSRE